jgi:scyllo-inositol 2-dehydrogenase (NADP+)
MEHIIVAGIASFGMSGRVFHAPLMTHNKHFRLKRIIERSKNESGILYPGILTARSLDDILEDDDIELIVVNTPDHTHFDLAKKCLEANKHVVVEKPFSQTVEQGEKLIELAKLKKRMVSVFQNRRWDGDFLTVQKIIKDKILGRLVDFESHFDRHKPVIQSDSWKEQANTGTLFNLGSHMIDQALVLFGMPEAVTAHLKIVRTGSIIDDWYDIRMHYPDINVNLKSSLLVKEPGPRYILHGTQGSFLKWGLDPQEDALKQGKDPDAPEWGREPKELWGDLNTEINGKPFTNKYETIPGKYGTFYENIYEHVIHEKELLVKPEEALNVIRIIEAVQKSSAQRKTINI